MNCLLIGGAQSVGKTETIYRLAKRLNDRGYLPKFGTISDIVDGKVTDFKVVLEGENTAGKTIRIIINSATDDIDFIRKFKVFFDDHSHYDILISSVRDHNFWPRIDFFKIMEISNTEDFVLEIPLAKITRRGENFPTALTWYQTQLDNLINQTLTNAPFNT